MKGDSGWPWPCGEWEGGRGKEGARDQERKQEKQEMEEGPRLGYLAVSRYLCSRAHLTIEGNCGGGFQPEYQELRAFSYLTDVHRMMELRGFGVRSLGMGI